MAKRVLIVSYLAYLPSILLLIFTRSFSGIALTMLSIGFAAGIFKPLVSATVRATTDRTNSTLGFGAFRSTSPGSHRKRRPAFTWARTFSQ